MVNSWEDYESTIFIGNLPFIVSEEELRTAFVDCGSIQNIRLVRDPKTHLGKGIGYIMFSSKTEMQDAIVKKKNLVFKGRELRINRATEPKRREKKKNRQEAALTERRERRAEKRAAEAASDEEEIPRNFADAYSSEDSDDDKIKKRKQDRQVRLENTSFGQRQQHDSRADRDEAHELTLNNQHALARKKK